MTSNKKARQFEFEQKIIEHVKTHPAIWKKSDSNHANAIVVGNNWDYIFDQLQPTEFAKNGQDVARNWKNLWNQYLAYKRKSKGKTGQKGGRKTSYRHSDAMRFCDDSDGPEKRTFSNAEDEVEDEEESDVAVDSDVVPNSVSENSQVVVTLTGVEPPVQSPHSQARISKKPKLDPFAETLLDVVKGHELNEFQHFCSSMAMKIKSIADSDKKRACRLQNDIQQLVFEAEMDIFV